MSPHEYCQQKAAQSGSSFYYSFLFLPEKRRRAITALYAYCREVDDVVDETSDAGVARAKLAWWRKEVASIYHGQPQHPVARALTEVVGPFELEEARLQEIIDGMAMDLEYNAIPTSRRSKSIAIASPAWSAPVGQDFRLREPADARVRRKPGACVPAHEHHPRRGRRRPAQPHLRAAGRAGRYGVTTDDITQGRETDDFRKLMAFQIERARGVYDTALAKLPARTARRSARGSSWRRSTGRCSRKSARRLARAHRRIALTPVRKLWIAWKTWIKGLNETAE